MLDLSKHDITLLCVSDIRMDETIKAIKHCMNQSSFREVKLLTSKGVEPINGVQVVNISPITTREMYSEFIITKLNNYVSTSYVLICQYDGIIVNPSKWSNNFLKYDYIGAPWKNWMVGNGGFSLRSKKLLDTIAAHLDIFNNKYHPEDAVLCRRVINQLRSINKSLVWAPVDIATQFSFEHAHYHDSFGAHNNRVVEKALKQFIG